MNVRSWISKVDEIKHLVVSSQVDILGITETWLSPSVLNSNLVPSVNFNIVRRDRPADVARTGGGVAFLLHPSVSFLHRPDLEPVNSNIEILCIQLLKVDSPTFVFVCYRPPNSDCSLFCSALRTSISQISDNNANIHILGDFNARLSHWYSKDPNTHQGQTLQNLFDDLSLTQLVHEHGTRFSPCGKKSSLLDLVITSHPHLTENLTVLPTVSDLRPVVFDLRIRPKRQTSTESSTEMRFNYRSVNWTDLNNQLWSLPLVECIDEARSVDEAWLQWKSMVEGVVLEHTGA